MLTVSRKKVQDWHKGFTEEIKELDELGHHADAAKLNNVIYVLDDLFGSKCMPDGLSEVKRDLSEVKQDLSENLSESQSAEPKETFTDECQSRERLYVASMAMHALVMRDGEFDGLGRGYWNSPGALAREALRYADALIAESEKGGSK